MLKRKNVLKRTVIAIVCCALVINTLATAIPATVNATTTDEATNNALTSKCMKITSKEYVYNATKKFRTFYADSYTSTTHSFINGRAVETDKTYGTAAIVVHVPEAFEGTASMELNSKLQRRYGNASTSSTSKHMFRVVKNDEIIYPTDGTWADVSGAWNGVTISGVSFEAQAGDDIYFILYDSAKKSNYANFYVDADMKIDGVTFDSSALDYSTSDPTSESYTGNTTTSDFFGGTYKRSELITYVSFMRQTEIHRFLMQMAC